MFELTAEEKERIKQYIQQFKDFLKSETAQEWDEDRKYRTKLIQKLLSKEHISSLSEDEFKEIIKTLWASQVWTNKDYLVDKILHDNSLQKIKEELKNLIYGTDLLEARFDRFRENIKGLGPSSITEILVFVQPDNFCLWNDKPKNVLPFLRLSLLPEKVFKYQIDGSDYVKCNDALNLIKTELKNSGFEKADFIDLDFFLAYIFYEVLEKQDQPIYVEKIKEKIPQIFIPQIEEIKIKTEELTHSDVQGILLELGNLLGYATYVADPSKIYKGKKLEDLATLKEIPAFTYQRLLDTVKYIDVIWFYEEFPKFCFEIEHTTGVTQGLLRLFQIRKITDAKFFVIAPKDIISKFKTEVSKDPFHQIRDRFIFRSYDELIDIFKSAYYYHKLRDDFFQ